MKMLSKEETDFGQEWVWISFCVTFYKDKCVFFATLFGCKNMGEGFRNEGFEILLKKQLVRRCYWNNF